MKPDGEKRYSITGIVLVLLLCLISYFLGVKQGASGPDTTDPEPFSAAGGEQALQHADGVGHVPLQDSSTAQTESGLPPAAREEIETEQKQRLMRNLAENLAMPGMTRIIRDQQRVLMAEQFRDLIETYDLNDEEKEYFIDLLTARQMYHVDMGMKLMTGMLSEEERDELLKRVGAGIEEMNEEIDWFLNNETDSEYFDFYERTEGERSVIEAVSARLDEAGQPLAEGMDKELVAIMHEQISDYPFSVQFEENGEPVFSRFTADNIDVFIGEMEDLREPIMEQAAQVLDEAQLEVFAGSFDQYVAFYDQRFRMVQQLFNPEK
jgi:hypothetical protein